MRDVRQNTWLTIAAVSILTACGPKQVSTIPNPPPAAGRRDVIVLLPDPGTNTTGAAGVSNPLGSVDLAAERDAALVTASRAPELTKLSETEVQSKFGDALSALPPAPRRFTLYFRFESDTLTDQSQALIPEVLAAVKAHKVQDVVIIGHTDTTGTQRTNYGLGLKRAMMVRSLLIQSGLSGNGIEATSVGELDALIKTPDETPEPRNRRVEISVR